jgi:hypothetical protein
MKKLLAASLIACAALSAFAQLSFSGKAYAGVQLEKQYDVDDEAWSVTHREKGAPRFDFAASALKENYGAKLDTTFTALADSPFALNGVYGWVNFLNGAVKLSAGKISDAAWVTSLDKEYKLDDVSGFRAEWNTPLQGLSVGAAFDVQDGYDTEKMFKQIVYGASFIHTAFNAVAAYDTGDNGQLIFGFNFTGIDKLTTAGVELKANSLHPDVWEKMGELHIGEKAVYQIIQRVGVSLYLTQDFAGDPDAKAGLSFTPGVSYRATREITAFLEATIGTTDSFDKKENSWFALKPYCEFALKGPALFYVEYELRLDEFKHDSHRFAFGLDIKAF